MKDLLRVAMAVLAKDLRVEFRTRYALSSVLLFALSAIAAVSYVLRQRSLAPEQSVAVCWIIVLFAALSGLSRSFVSEAEASTELLLRQTATPEAVWLGKLLFNMLLVLALEALIFPLYSGMMGQAVTGAASLAGVALLGAVSLAGVTTILAAMVSRGRSQSSVFAVAAFPVLLPALIFLVQASGPSMGTGAPAGEAAASIRALISYTGIMLVASWFLFPVIWDD